MSLVDQWKKARKNCFFSFLLFLLSQVYRFLLRLRQLAYKSSLFACYQSKLPVLSVGNLSLGGNGKTPTCLLLAQKLPFKLAFLTRGYLSKAEHSPQALLVNSQLHSAADCGDEALLLAKNCPKALVIANKKRALSALLAEKLRAELIILDDGMQQLAIKKDFELVVIDAKEELEKGRLLPLGRFREPLSALKRADHILLNHVESEAEFQLCKKKLEQYSRASISATYPKIQSFHKKNGESISLKGEKVAVFCSLGKPEHFCRTLLAEGLDLVNKVFYPDHHPIEEEDLLQFSIESQKKGANYLLCSEKDQVKLTRHKYSLEVCYSKMQLELSYGKPAFEDFLKRVQFELKA